MACATEVSDTGCDPIVALAFLYGAMSCDVVGVCASYTDPDCRCFGVVPCIAYWVWSTVASDDVVCVVGVMTSSDILAEIPFDVGSSTGVDGSYSCAWAVSNGIEMLPPIG